MTATRQHIMLLRAKNHAVITYSCCYSLCNADADPCLTYMREMSGMIAIVVLNHGSTAVCPLVAYHTAPVSGRLVLRWLQGIAVTSTVGQQILWFAAASMYNVIGQANVMIVVCLHVHRLSIQYWCLIKHSWCGHYYRRPRVSTWWRQQVQRQTLRCGRSSQRYDRCLSPRPSTEHPVLMSRQAQLARAQLSD